MTGGDVMMRKVGNSSPMPQFEATPWVTPKPLAEATVAIVTSAALHRPDDDGFVAGNDASYRVLDRADRELVLGHWRPNFDRSAFQQDPNIWFPLDRLREMAASGEIGGVSRWHYSFMGAMPRPDLYEQTAEEVGRLLAADEVDVALLVPV